MARSRTSRGSRALGVASITSITSGALGALGALVALVALLGTLPACEQLAGYDDAIPWTRDAQAGSPNPRDDDGATTPDDTPFDASAPPPTGSRDAGAGTGERDATTPTTTDAATPVRDSGTPPVTPDSGPPPCTAPVGDACSSIARFTGTQTIDGKPDDFCGVPVTTYTVASAAFRQGKTQGNYPQRVSLRVAWSDTALHVHASVTDPKILVSTEGDIINGDGFMLYVGASATASGNFNGTNDGGAMQIFVTPASGTFGTRAYAYYYNPPSRTATIDPQLFASRVLPGGYEIELRVPWSGARDANAIRQGARILLNPALSIKDDASVHEQDLEIAVAAKPLPQGATTTCAAGVYAPWCDDRMWCTPQLQ